MPKISLAIKSCFRHAGRRQACLATWLPDWQNDFVFLIGKPVNIPIANSLIVQSSDAFTDIAPKVQAACRWALAENNDFLVIADDDTYLRPERLLVSGFEKHDYVGWVRPHGDVSNGFQPYMQGNCFILSAKAMEIIASSDTMVTGIPDDCATGRVLAGKVDFVHQQRFWPGPCFEMCFPSKGNEIISTHKCLPNDMLKAHELWKKD